MSSHHIPKPVLRRACDRCHTHKLSCHRNHIGPCARCVKANATCTSSPSLRNRRNRPLPRQPSPMSHKDSSTAEKRPRALSTAGSDIEDETAHTFNEVDHEFSQATVGENDHHLLHVDDTLNWMDDVASGTLPVLARLSDDSHAGTPSTHDWDNNARASSSKHLHLSSLVVPTPTSTPDNGCFILQSLGIMTPSTSSSICKWSDDMNFDPIIQIANSKSNATDTVVSSASSLNFTSRSASTTSPLPTHPHLNPPLSHESTPLSDPVLSQEPLPRTNQADSQWLQKLVEVNVQLFNHANLVVNAATPLASCSNSSDTNANDDLTPDSSMDSGSSGFNDTLELSLNFLQALRKLHGGSSHDLSIHTTATPPPALDPGTTLIIYSCYIRVLELFIVRLTSIQGSLNAAAANFSASTSSAPTTAKVPPLALPTLTACSCPLDDFPILRIRITLELMEEILDVTSALLMSIMRGSQSRPHRRHEEQAMPWRRQSLMPEVSQQALLVRENTAYQIIRNIRRELKVNRRAMM